jgi:hypothetical protein
MKDAITVAEAKSTRVRQSLYLLKEVLVQVDKAFEEMEDNLYPLEIDKAEYLETCLLFAIECEEEIRERIEEKKGKPCNQCSEGTHETCSRCGTPICDDCAVKSGDPGYGAYLSEGTRCCPGECAKKYAGFDNL